ncbi:MAG: hypothetical protein AB7Y46_09290 [Armatimonadota bacterium]
MRRLPYEDSYSHWISLGIAQFFRELGYRVFHDTVGQPNEALVPLDRVYSVAKDDSQVLLFGLQFKRPSSASRPSWRIVLNADDDQFERLRRDYSDWIRYALPYFRDVAFHSVALDMVHFVCPTRLCPTAKQVKTLSANLLLPVPGCGPHCPFCHELLHLWHHDRCLHCHDDPELRRLGRDVRRFVSHDEGCLCALTAPDSWGTLVVKLLSRRVGVVISSRQELSGFFDERFPSELLGRNAVLVAIDIIERAVSVVGGFAGEIEEEREDEVPFDDDVPEWPV